MKDKGYPKVSLRMIAIAGVLFLCSVSAHGQDTRDAASSSSSSAEAPAEVRALSELIRGLQAQVQTLNSQLGDLRMEQERASAEARELRRELDLVKAQGAPAANGPLKPYSAPSATESAAQPVSTSSPTPPQPQTAEDRIGKLEEDQQVMDGKINDQYLTKVESGSKYRLRLSGIVLLNLFENRGTVDNLDFPQNAESPASPTNTSTGSFGGTLRQSQIRLQAFGPDVGGARTSADINFDFAGGFPNTTNGATMGLARLRTGTIRLDWANTSIVAGQDHLFFAPLAPASLASLAAPALSYSGNLWAWTPQVRVEHRIVLSEASSFSFQAGILDSLSGDYPDDAYLRYPAAGELSGEPAYAARVSWSHRAFGQNLTVGFGGYYGRQNQGFSRNVDGWAGTTDVTLPLGKLFEFTGEFYRGRAVAGVGGGIGRTALFTGSVSCSATTTT